MKLYGISILTIAAGALAFTSCADLDQQPQGGTLTENQSVATNSAIPSRTTATFSGMFSMMGDPRSVYPTSQRADDFGFIMMAISDDLEGADMQMQNNDYNWFSTCGELSSRNANYANPYIRYVIPFREIGVCNQVIASYPAGTTDATAVNHIAQARAMRAFSYMSLAPYFQFSYATAGDSACVPILKDGTDYTNNPRATVKEVYAYIMDDLNAAVEALQNSTARTSKDQIDINVAYGLRARANLAMGNYADAASDAEKAAAGYTPASLAEVSVPAFDKISEHNWIWGINITDAMVQDETDGYASASSWLSAFSGDGFAPACQCVPVINKMLYDKIPSTDVRKGWWLNDALHSPNWANCTWNGVSGDAIANLTIENVKLVMLPYMSIKFGMKSGVGNALNNNDWPLMRVEEMLLIEVEGYAKSGFPEKAKQILKDFVQTYRDPSYDVNNLTRSLEDEIWYQRRVELWGEGFFTGDAKRLNKPVVRFHGSGTCNFPDAFIFNMYANDKWLNMRFPQTEMNNNAGIIDNTGGSQPEAGQNPNLRDGVTD